MDECDDGNHQVQEIDLEFEAFYRAEYSRVYRAAVLVAPDPQLALDATQEAFERAYARWHRLSRHEWAGGWVMTTALNLCRKQHRSRKKQFTQNVPPAQHDLDTSAIELRQGLLKLPLRQREAITLFYVGDLSLHAIAEVMGLSEGAVKAHLSHGRKRLRRALEVRDEGG